MRIVLVYSYLIPEMLFLVKSVFTLIREQVEMRGLEPLTSALQRQRSPS